MSSDGPKYTDQQAYRYLKRINFPLSTSLSTPLSLPPPTLDTLRRLVAGHLHAIPFENLSLHYSKRRTITLEPDFLFDKFVNQQKGGYCMEQNRAFSTLLRTLGYDLYTVGGRVFHGPDKGQVRGFGHMAIILTLDNIEYLVDVGFGGSGLTAPLPIFNGQVIEDPIKGVIPEEHRIHRAEILGSAKKGHKSWMLQSRRNPHSEWENQYSFEKDFEFFGSDYEVYGP
jgi:arylamine N-acetyltransferase